MKTKDRDPTIKSFQEGNLQVMLCQVDTGGLGIQLYAAGLVIFLSNSYSHFKRSQAEDRVHRTGLEHNVTYVDLLSIRHKGGKTVDHTVRKAVTAKKDLADMLLALGDLDGQV